MKKQLVVSLGLLGCVVFTLADDVKQSPAPKAATPTAPAVATKAQNEETYPVIGYLERRNYQITIKASPHGTVYTFATKDGKVLHENLSAEQLKAQAPEFYDAIKTGLATDARIWPQEKNPRGGFGGAIESPRAPQALYMQMR